jgi:predicted small lipoprotein YifL
MMQTGTPPMLSRTLAIFAFALTLAACGVKSDLVPPGAMAAGSAGETNTPLISIRTDPSKPLRPLGQRERDESATASAISTALPPTGP